MTDRAARIQRGALTLFLLGLAALLVALALALPGAGRAAGAHGAARFRASLSTAGSRPRVNTAWYFTVKARNKHGKGLRARVQFEYWLSGTLKVAEGPRCRGDFRRLNRCIFLHKRPRFRGTFRDFVCYPPQALGNPLQFRAIVTTSLGSRTLRRNFKPVPGRRKETAACKRPTRGH